MREKVLWSTALAGLGWGKLGRRRAARQRGWRDSRQEQENARDRPPGSRNHRVRGRCEAAMRRGGTALLRLIEAARRKGLLILDTTHHGRFERNSIGAPRCRQRGPLLQGNGCSGVIWFNHHLLPAPDLARRQPSSVGNNLLLVKGAGWWRAAAGGGERACGQLAAEQAIQRAAHVSTSSCTNIPGTPDR